MLEYLMKIMGLRNLEDQNCDGSKEHNNKSVTIIRKNGKIHITNKIQNNLDTLIFPSVI